MPAGINDVADVGHAVFAKLSLAKLQNLLLDFTADPGVHAVTQDVIELAIRVVEVCNALVDELQVLETQLAGSNLSDGDLALRIVDADEPGVRKAIGQWDQLLARRATQFQHPRAIDRHGVQTEQQAQSGQPVRIRLRKRLTWVWQLVVAGAG